MEPFFTSYLELLHSLIGEFVKTFDDLPDEALDWVPGADMNSLVVLVVHTTGSARFWIGDMALGESSNRDRASEFVARGLNKNQLKARFEVLKDYVRGAAERLSAPDFGVARTTPDGKRTVTAQWALLHALEHTAVHLGHAQITRQMWQQRAGQ
jgi:uncharacterized damage-inducible protein DinB